MKNIWIVFAAVLLFSILLTPTPSLGTELSQAKKIGNVLSHMNWAEDGYKESLQSVEGARLKLETDVLGQTGQDEIRDLIGRNEELANAYRADAQCDLDFLKDHWKSLTPQQKGSAERAEVDLN